MRSRGSLELRKLGTGKEIAQKTGKTEGYISRILSGRQDPSQGFKEIAADLGIPIEAWNETIIDPEIRNPAAPDAPAPVPTADNVRELTGRLMRTAQELEAEIAQEASVYERMRYLEKLAGITVDLGKLTGASIVNARMLLMSPGWAQVSEVITKALEPWPDAMRAVAEALLEPEK